MRPATKPPLMFCGANSAIKRGATVIQPPYATPQKNQPTKNNHHFQELIAKMVAAV